MKPGKKVFIVHGSNHNLRNAIALFIQNDLRLETVVMDAKAHKGRTLPEKFEEIAEECGFAVVLVTLDDRLIKGESLTQKDFAGKNIEKRRIRRPRQNVVLEAGYFWGKMGRKRVAFLVEQSKGQQIPSDLSGIGYIPITKDLGRTKEELRKELEAWKTTWDAE